MSRLPEPPRLSGDTSDAAIRRQINQIGQHLRDVADAMVDLRASIASGAAPAEPSPSTVQFVRTTLGPSAFAGLTPGVPEPITIATVPAGAVVLGIRFGVVTPFTGTGGLIIDPSAIAAVGGGLSEAQAKSPLDLTVGPADPDLAFWRVVMIAGPSGMTITAPATLTGSAPTAGSLVVSVLQAVP